MVTITTDGACSNNQDASKRRAGAGVVITSGVERQTFSKPLGPLTNQQAEVEAVRIGLIEAYNLYGSLAQVTVRSDSLYVVKTMRGEFRRKTNLAYWDALDRAVRLHGKVIFEWVKGHNGDRDQEAADSLATTACRK